MPLVEDVSNNYRIIRMHFRKKIAEYEKATKNFAKMLEWYDNNGVQEGYYGIWVMEQQLALTVLQTLIQAIQLIK